MLRHTRFFRSCMGSLVDPSVPFTCPPLSFRRHHIAVHGGRLPHPKPCTVPFRSRPRASLSRVPFQTLFHRGTNPRVSPMGFPMDWLSRLHLSSVRFVFADPIQGAHLRIVSLFAAFGNVWEAKGARTMDVVEEKQEDMLVLAQKVRGREDGDENDGKRNQRG